MGVFTYLSTEPRASDLKMEPSGSGSTTAGEDSDFIFNNQLILYILDEAGEIWFRAKEILSILQFGKNYLFFAPCLDAENQRECREIRRKITNLESDNLQPEAVFVSESALFSLIGSSRASHAGTFKKFVLTKLVPAIRRKEETLEKVKSCVEAIEWAENDVVNEEVTSKQGELENRVETLIAESVEKDSAYEELKSMNVDLTDRIRCLTEERQASETTLGLVEGELQHARAIYEVKKIEEEGLRINLRTSENLASVMKEDFSPKVSDEGKWEGVVFFRLYNTTSLMDPYTHYAIRAQARSMTDQIKRLKAKHPEAVEIARIGYHPNAVNKFNLLKEWLADRLRSHGNYFGFRDQTYTETQFLQDVRTTNDESFEIMRKRIQTQITSYFRVVPKEPDMSEAGPSGESCPPPAKKQRPGDSDSTDEDSSF